MSGLESYMINYVCSTKGILLIPVAPWFILANPFGASAPLFGFAWATVILIFVILSISPCATDLNCARVAEPTVTSSIEVLSIACTGVAQKRITYTGASGFAEGIRKGALITVSGATNPIYNGSFYVTEVTNTTVVVRGTVLTEAEPSTSATIDSYINYNSLRDGQKAITKSILIYYLLFLFFAVWGRLFLCKSPGSSKGYLGSIADGLNKTYEIPNSSSNDDMNKEALAKVQQVEVENQTRMLETARKQVEQAQQKARALVNSSNSGGGAGSAGASLAQGATSFLQNIVSGSSKTS
jgi:hypothetical protein